MDYYDGMTFSDSDDERFAMSGGIEMWAMDDDDYGYGHPSRYDDTYYQDSEDDDMDDDDDDEMSAHPSRRYAAPPAPPPPPPPAPTPTLCRFFVLGKCRFGSRCTFSHTLSTDGSADQDATAQAAKTVDCPFFLRGKCKYGRSCRLRHGPAYQGGDDPQLDSLLAAARASVGSHGARARGAAASSAPPSAASAGNQQQELTCGICFEDIVEAGKHFGLLSCDHCYCLDCLRAWRQSKEQEVEVTRACPACRVPSNFIVPSLTFCTGEQKNKVVDEYKRHLAFRECKYFDGSLGSCPFGPNCFYAHRNALGEDVKHRDRPRRRRSESSGSAASSSVSGGGRSRRGSRGRQALPEAVASILERYSEFFRLMQSLERDGRGSQQDSH